MKLKNKKSGNICLRSRIELSLCFVVPPGIEPGTPRKREVVPRKHEVVLRVF